jgi:hypothetical protein
MLDVLDHAILEIAYTEIDKSASKRVTGAAVFVRVPGLAPVIVPARLRRLVSHGLLAKNLRNSSNRTKVYAPTEDGYMTWRQIR